MERKSFLKGLFFTCISPSIIGELDIPTPPLVNNTVNLFRDLQLLIPDYLPKMMEKYGNDDTDFELLRKSLVR